MVLPFHSPSSRLFMLLRLLFEIDLIASCQGCRPAQVQEHYNNQAQYKPGGADRTGQVRWRQGSRYKLRQDGEDQGMTSLPILILNNTYPPGKNKVSLPHKSILSLLCFPISSKQARGARACCHHRIPWHFGFRYIGLCGKKQSTPKCSPSLRHRKARKGMQGAGIGGNRRFYEWL